MWITRTSEYVWTLMPDGSFYKADSSGCLMRQSNPCSSPGRNEDVTLLPGIDDHGNECILYVRVPVGCTDPYGCRYETFSAIGYGNWRTIDSYSFYRYLNPKHIINAQRTAAEQILLGQT